MNDLLRRFSINCHSSIRCGGSTVLWFDPFRVAEVPQDGDVIFITHEHYDHFSPEDLRRVMKPDAVLVLPESCLTAAKAAGFSRTQLFTVQPEGSYEVRGVSFRTVPAYNISKPFHPKASNWVGYVVTVDRQQVYVAGDTDNTPEARAVHCDAAFLPVGGAYTMTATEAAELANALHPQAAVPTHYGCIVGEKTDGDVFAAALAPAITCIKML